MKKLLFVGLLLLGLLAGYIIWANRTVQKEITTFEECAAAGYPIAESYPEQCQTPDGKVFVRNIHNTPDYSDIIQVTAPQPNQGIASPLQISGQARGTWYFEANFPIELVDQNRNSIAVGYATAKGDWMTENFVPFTAQLTFTKPATPTGSIIFKNANPSGLPEEDKSVIIPIAFE